MADWRPRRSGGRDRLRRACIDIDDALWNFNAALPVVASAHRTIYATAVGSSEDAVAPGKRDRMHAVVHAEFGIDIAQVGTNGGF